MEAVKAHQLNHTFCVVCSDRSNAVDICFREGIAELSFGELDIHDMRSHLCEFGASDDEAEMTVWRDVTARVALGKKTVLPVLDVISIAGSKGACEGGTLLG